MLTRSFLALALALGLGSTVAGQEPSAPTSEPMRPMMDCMHSDSTMQMHGMPMGGMMMMMGEGMGMRGMESVPSPSAETMDGCSGCNSRNSLAALFGRPIAGLTITEEQRAELDALVDRARSEALAVLTPEQRTALEAQAPAAAGMCVPMPGTPEVEHQH
jgi:hypothetical protein